MPELPEVEWFRQVLLPLVDEEGRNPPISFELHGEKPPRKWVAAEDVASHTGKWRCTAVLRKGKQLCMVLEKGAGAGRGENSTTEKCYFYLHMGMTGRLISPTKSCTWGHKYASDSPNLEGEEGREKSWPPKFTYLVLSSGETTVAFADPRKFGACHFEFDDDNGGGGSAGAGGGASPSSPPSPSLFGDLAPDALSDTETPEKRLAMAAKLAHQRLGVKALLLDQKRVVSGVGNWVADEVLYGTGMHPDQSHLAEERALAVVEALRDVVSIAVDCLERGTPYPDEWLFGYRWTKKKAGKDHRGRSLTFVTSGGRTSAIVASLQKLRKTDKKAAAAAAAGKTKAKGRGVKVKESSSLEAEAETGTAATVDEKEDSAAPRKRKAAGGKAAQKGAGKRTKLDRRRSGSRKTNVADSSDPNAKDRSPDPVPSLSSASDDRTNKADNRKQQKKKAVKKESQAGELKKEDSPATVEDEESAEALFRREKEAALLEGVDQSVRDDFRRTGFAKWQKDWLPVIQLGPYDVPPGPVRDSWMKLLWKNTKTKRARPTQKRLVYWYGSNRDDLSASFSFVNEGSVIGYEEGVARGVCDGISSRIQAKMKRNARLTAKEKLIVEGLKEVRDESALSREERVVWLNVEEAHGK